MLVQDGDRPASARIGQGDVAGAIEPSDGVALAIVVI
jgi:hypothetical protein